MIAAVIALLMAACASDSAETTSTEVPGSSTTVQPAFVSQPGDGIPVVVDYNPTTSDVSALLYLVQQDGFRVDAITIPGTGESHCEQAVANTLGLLALVDRAGIPVACGSPNPISGDNRWPDAWRQTADALPGLTLPQGGEASSLSGPALLAAAVSQSAEPVKLLTLGPLTNVAEALALEPAMVSNLDAIYIMGGAVDVAGNVFANDFAEWNLWIDPVGAKAVIESGAPIVLVPLDATNEVPLTSGWHNQLAKNRATPAAGAVFDLFASSPGVLEGGFYFWDELAASVLVDHSYATLETRKLTVVTQGPEEGRTKEAADGVDVQVAVDADGDRFKSDLISGLNGGLPVAVPVIDPEMGAYFLAMAELGERFDTEISAFFAENEQDLAAVFEGEQVPITEARELIRRFVALAFDLLRKEATAELDPPPAVLDLHREYFEANQAALDVEAETLELISNADLDELASLFEESELALAVEALTETCLALQEFADSQGLDVNLLCFG